MKKYIVKIIIISIIVLIIRFVFSGPEDSWICINGNWEKHGNPIYNPPIITEIIAQQKISNLPEIKKYFQNLGKNGIKGIIIAEKKTNFWLVKVISDLPDRSIVYNWYQVDFCGKIKKLEI